MKKVILGIGFLGSLGFLLFLIYMSLTTELTKDQREDRDHLAIPILVVVGGVCGLFLVEIDDDD